MSETTDPGTQAGEIPAIEPDATAIETGDTGATPAETANPEPTEAPKKRPWYEKAIANKAHDARELRRQNEFLTARLQEVLQRPADQTQPQAPAGFVPASEVPKAAAQMVAQERYLAACSDIADAGTKLDAQEFPAAVRNLQLLGVDPDNARHPLMEIVTDSGAADGAKILYELGRNPDEAERILALSPVRMAREIDRLMQAASERTVPVSKTPAPITPITPSSPRTRAVESMTDREQFEHFRKTLNSKG